MKGVRTIEQLERLEDQLQVIKWTLRLSPPIRRGNRQRTKSIVTRTAGLLRGRLPQGRVYQRQLRQEWERRLTHEAA